MSTLTERLSVRSILALGLVAAAGAAIGFTTMSQPDNDDEADGGERVTVIKLSEAPGSVREAFTRRAEGGKATRVERIVAEDVTKYEIDYDAKGGASSMTFTDHGEVLEIESPVADGGLPEAVRREIEKDHPGATIKHADLVQVFFYEVAVEMDGKPFEVIALATGDIEDGVFGGESDEHGEADEDDEHGEHADHDDDHGRGHADDDDESDEDDD